MKHSSGWWAALAALVAVGLLSAAAMWLLRSDRETPETDGAPSSAAEQSESDGSDEESRDEESAAATRSPLESPEDLDGEIVLLHGFVRHELDGSALSGATVEGFESEPPRSFVDFRAGIRSALASSEVKPVHDLQSLGTQNRSWLRETTDEVAEPTADTEITDADSGAGAAPADTGRRPLTTATTEADGTFRLRVPADTERLHLRVRGAIAIAPVCVTLPREAPVEILVRNSATIRGRVLLSDRSPARGARVSIEAEFDPFALVSGAGTMMSGDQSSVDADGRFEFDSLPTGMDFVLTAREGAAAPKRQRVSVVAPRDYEVEFQLDEETELTVHVRAPSGDGVEGAGVSLMPARIVLTDMSSLGDDLGADRRTDPSGEARFAGLSAMRWLVMVRKRGWFSPEPVAVEVTEGTPSKVEVVLDPGRVLTGRVQDRDGTPIDSARVRCLKPPSLTNIASLTTAQNEPWTRVDDQGSFRIQGLVEEPLLMEVRARGYRNADVDLPAHDRERTVTMEKLGVLEGIVLARDGHRLLERFWVEVEREEGFSLDLRQLMRRQLVPLRMEFSSEDGRFRIEGVEPGTWTLTAGAEGFAPFTSDPIEVVVDRATPRIVCALLAESVLAGRVIDDRDGTPIADASVYVQSGVSNPILDAAGQMFAEENTKSDDSGAFRVGSLAEGRYSVIVRHPEYAELSVGGIELSARTERNDLELRMLAGGTIHGQVTSPEGGPEPGARIIATRTTQQMAGSAVSDADGWYRIEGLAAGDYALTRVPSQFALDSERLFEQLSQGFESKNAHVESGAEVRVDFGTTLRAGSARVHGRVLAKSGPVKDVLVSLITSDDAFAPTSSSARTTATDANGEFLFSELPPGRVILQCQIREGMETLPSRMLWRECELVDGETEEVEFRLPGGAIRGRLLATDDGRVLGGVPVRAVPFSSTSTTPNPWDGFARQYGANATTDREGRFKISSLEPGTYTVLAGGRDLLGLSAAYAETRVGPVEVRVGDVDLGDLRVPPGGSVEGVVKDGSGRPVTGATVVLRAADGGWLHSFSMVATDGSGAFSYGGLSSGVYDIVVRAPNLAQNEVRGVRVEAGSPTRVGAVTLLGGTAVYLDVSGIDDAARRTLRIEVFGPEGRILSGAFGAADLQSALFRRLDARPYLGTYGPGHYIARGTYGDVTFEREWTLAGEDELVVTLDTGR